MAGGSKQPSTTTQTSKTEPWSGQQPYLQDLFARAQGASQSTPQYFPGQTVAPQSQATQQSMALAQQTAGGLQPLAQGTIDSSIFNLGAGRDVANNPYLQSAIQGAINPLLQNFQSVGGPLSQIRSGFTANNSGGSGTREGIAAGVAQRGLQQQVGDISSGMTFQAYQAAQDNALRTLALAPQTMQGAAFPASLMGQVGGQQDAYAQSLINAAMERHNFQQQAPWMPIQQYGQIVAGGNFGSSGTSSTTAPAARTNPLMQGIGGATSGLALSSLLAPGAAGATGMAAFGPYALPAMGVGALLGLLG